MLCGDNLNLLSTTLSVSRSRPAILVLSPLNEPQPWPPLVGPCGVVVSVGPSVLGGAGYGLRRDTRLICATQGVNVVETKRIAITVEFSVRNRFSKQTIRPLENTRGINQVHRERQKAQNEVKRGNCRIIWGNANEMGRPARRGEFCIRHLRGTGLPEGPGGQ